MIRWRPLRLRYHRWRLNNIEAEIRRLVKARALAYTRRSTMSAHLLTLTIRRLREERRHHRRQLRHVMGLLGAFNNFPNPPER